MNKVKKQKELSFFLSLSSRQVLAIPLTAFIGLLTTKISFSAVGTQWFGIVGTVAGLSTFLIFLDFGTSGPVVNNVALALKNKDSVLLSKTLNTATSYLITTSAIFIVFFFFLTKLNIWSKIFSHNFTYQDNLIIFFLCAIYCLAIPMGIWGRVLQGLGEQKILVVTSVVLACINLFTTTLFWHFSVYPLLFILTGNIAYFVNNFLNLFLSLRKFKQTGLNFTFKLEKPSFAMFRTMEGALPMLFLNISFPIAYTVARFMLMGKVSAYDLSLYSFIMLIFTLSNSIIQTVGNGVWPYFVNKRENAKDTIKSINIFSLIFLAFGILTGLALIIFGPLFVKILSSNELKVSESVLIACAILIFVQSLSIPLISLLTTPKELKFQGICSVLMVVATIVASHILIPLIGINAPFIALASSILIFQVLPYRIMMKRFILNRDEVKSSV
ncbi:MAG: hypothetical protein QM632_04025 [Micrococcaceae bacterium]